MRERMRQVRARLAAAGKTGGVDLTPIGNQNGLFSIIPFTARTSGRDARRSWHLFCRLGSDQRRRADIGQHRPVHRRRSQGNRLNRRCAKMGPGGRAASSPCLAPTSRQVCPHPTRSANIARSRCQAAQRKRPGRCRPSHEVLERMPERHPLCATQRTLLQVRKTDRQLRKKQLVARQSPPYPRKLCIR